MDNLIKLENLTIFPKNDKDRLLVNNVSLEVEKGTILGIVGESGSGKSLTVKSLMNLMAENLDRELGLLIFDGQEVNLKSNLPISMIFQDPMTSLNPLKTIGFHLIEIIQRFDNLDKNQTFLKAVDMLEKVGISQAQLRMTQYPFELSGGMRQRVMIAMALLANPKLLIADEPTTALDVTIQMQILSLIYKLQKEMGLTVILVSHDFGVISGMCDNVLVMYQGKVVEKGSVKEIFENPQHNYTKKLLSLARFDMKMADLPLSSKGELVFVSPTHQVRMEEANE